MMKLEPVAWKYRYSKDNAWDYCDAHKSVTLQGRQAEIVNLFTEAQLKQAILDERDTCADMAHGLAADGVSGFDIGHAIRARKA